jgi:leucyl aminopeptidase
MTNKSIGEVPVTTENAESLQADALVLFRFQDSLELSELEKALDEKLRGDITSILEDGDFKGKTGEVSVLYTHGAVPAKRLLLVGLGKAQSFSLEAVRISSAVALKRVQELGLKHACTYLPGLTSEKIDLQQASREFIIGAELGLYVFKDLKSKKEADQIIERLTICIPGDADAKATEKALQAGRKIATGVYTTRDLVNWPSNIATPTFLAEKASQIGADLKLKCQVLDEAEMKELGMGALLAVTSGSDQPAKFIIMEHNAGRDDLDTLVLVGKGVTFDTGGISLKPHEGMERMKSDMSGAAAVIGAIQAAALLELPLHVVALVPAVENMPGGNAYRPADVVTAMNGKTIEVISTDAEGRMLLADSLCYADRFSPKAIVDIATLTGARVVALGDYAIGLFSNDDQLAARLETAGLTTHERVWRMPLFDEYRDQLKSYVADMKHSGGRPAGSITAAKFLQEFVGENSWAHLDIAGLVSEKNYAYTPGWATGVGTRLLCQFLMDWS